MRRYWIEGINPLPWTAPGIGVVRRGGKPVPTTYKDGGLAAYQEAVRDALEDQVAGETPETYAAPSVWLRFYLWRELPSYQGDGARRSTRNVADATNMQKALEDACQGVLFKNDRQVKDIATVIVEQSPTTQPFIVIEADLYGDGADEYGLMLQARWQVETAERTTATSEASPDYAQLDLF